MKKIAFGISIIGLLTINSSFAQLVPAFSDDQLPLNQPIEVTTNDNKVIKGILKAGMQMNHKLKSFTVAPESGGEKIRLTAEEVKEVKMKPTNLQKIAEIIESSRDVNKMKDIKNIVNTDWIYFESVVMPNSDKSFLMQRLNPGENNNKIKVYCDPNAKQEASAGVGGMSLTGGKDKSYYIISGDGKKSILAEKKRYEEQIAEIYGNCPEFKTNAGTDLDWGKFPQHVALYNYFCK